MTYFAIQYRDMHSAIHHLCVCSSEEYAQWLYDYIKDNEEFPDDNQQAGIIADFEVDFHNVPEEHNGELIDVIVSHTDGRYTEVLDCY